MQPTVSRLNSPLLHKRELIRHHQELQILLPAREGYLCVGSCKVRLRPPREGLLVSDGFGAARPHLLYGRRPLKSVEVVRAVAVYYEVKRVALPNFDVLHGGLNAPAVRSPLRYFA